MKKYYKENKSIAQANAYLKKIGLADYTIDDNALSYGEFEIDSWINEEETKGVAVRIEKDFTVVASKYTKKDIEKLEAEL